MTERDPARSPRRVGWSPSALGSGALLLASGVLPWVADGPGSSYRGVELAAAIRNSAVLPDAVRLAGYVVLAVALIGVLHLATLSLVGTPIVLLRAITGGFVLSLVVLIALGVGIGNWGTGLWSAAIGSIIAVATPLEPLFRRVFG